MGKKSNDTMPTVEKLAAMTRDHREQMAAERERLTLQREAADDAMQDADDAMGRALLASDADAYHEAKQARSRAADTIEMIDLRLANYTGGELSKEEFTTYVQAVAEEVYRAYLAPAGADITATRERIRAETDQAVEATRQAVDVLAAAQAELCAEAADMLRPGGLITYIRGAAVRLKNFSEYKGSDAYNPEMVGVFHLEGGNE